MTGTHRIRSGFTSGGALSPDAWFELARQLESLGYDVLGVPDHLPARFSTSPALMAAASATKHLHMASWVYCNDLHHPLTLYKDAATIDMLSGGRMELGVGAGWMLEDYQQSGVSFDPPGVRVSRFIESATILRKCMQEQRVTFPGVFYDIKDFEPSPLPTNQNGIPLYIGGGGRRLLSWAASQADIVGFCPRALPKGGLDEADISWESLQRKCTWMDEVAVWDERAPEKNILVFDIRIEDNLPEDSMDSPHLFYGTCEQILHKSKRLVEEFGITYFTNNSSSPDTIEPFAEIMRGLRQTL